MVFGLLGVAFDVASVVGVCWGRKNCSIVMGHLGHSQLHGGHAHGAEQRELNVWASLMHIIVDFGRSMAVAIVAIVCYCGSSNETASQLDAWTALVICIIGLATSIYLLIALWIQFRRHSDDHGDEELNCTES